MTVMPEGLADGSWIDLGATWLWSDQPEVQALARDLGVVTFPQYRDGLAVAEDGPDAEVKALDFPAAFPAELRLVGGAQHLCFGLADRLPEDTISFATSVVGVDEEMGGLVVTVADAEGRTAALTAASVVVAVPPRLALQRIRFSPPLSVELSRVLEGTPTWMGTALKAVAVYESAFWREGGRSGLAFSEAGPLVEVHDGCTDDGSAAALWGFVSADHAFRDLAPGDRAELVLAQLARLFGPAAGEPVQYFERDWSDDPHTNDEIVWVGEPLAYGHPLLATPAFGGRLVWAGAETVAEGGGHMEGAVRSGRRAARAILVEAGRS
jgi:monoamine oxidase